MYKSNRRSNKEAIFTLYLKKHPKVIEDIIGIPIDGVKIEETIGKKRIDLYAINRERRIEIFVENQIGRSDKSNHLLDKVVPLINNTAEGYILWIAEGFQQKHIDEVIQLLQNNRHKYINFYALEIQAEVLKYIEYLNTLDMLDRWYALDSINQIKEKLRVFDKNLEIPDTHIGRALISETEYDLDSDYGIKKYLMKKFLERIPYHLNLHYSKKHSKNNKQLSIGAGIGGITYDCFIPSYKRKAFVVGIRFESWLSIAYHLFKEKEDLLKSKICSDIYFDDRVRMIKFNIKSERDNIPVIANQIAVVMEKFILFFSPYIYDGKIQDIINSKRDIN